MQVIVAKFMSDETGEIIARPRFFVQREDNNLEAEEAEALALTASLGRAAGLAFMTSQFPGARRAGNPGQWSALAAKALEVLQQMDPLATAFTEYFVAPVTVYAGPAEDITPELAALAASFAANSAAPPQSATESILRLFRDGQ